MVRTSEEYFPMVDCCKLFMAVVVVAIHTLQPFVETLPIFCFRIMNIIMGLAVPYFFVASGFMLHNKLKTNGLCAVKLGG